MTSTLRTYTVTVSSQAVVLTSTTVNPANPRGIGLYIYNPERYGTLPNAPGNPLLVRYEPGYPLGLTLVVHAGTGIPAAAGRRGEGAASIRP